MSRSTRYTSPRDLCTYNDFDVLLSIKQCNYRIRTTGLCFEQSVALPNIVKVNQIHSVFSVLFVWTEHVCCFKNCADLLWETIVLVIVKNFWKFEVEGWKIANFSWSLEQFYTDIERSEQDLKQSYFIISQWSFLRI